MKRLLLIITFLLYGLPAFAEPSCLQLPIAGDGMDVKGVLDDSKLDNKHGSFRPDIPKQITDLYPKLAYTYTTIGFPKIIGGKPEFSTLFACFLDSLVIPSGLGPMTRDYAAMLAHNRDPKVAFNPDVLKIKEPKTTAALLFDRFWRVASRYLGAAVAWATTSADNFNRADSADMGAAWDPYIDACRIKINAASSSTNAVECVEGYSTLIPGGNQYAQAVLSQGFLNSGRYVWLIVRLQAPTTYSGYYCRAQSDDQTNTSRIRRVDAGSSSTLANDTTVPQWVAGDVLRCEITGTTITFKKNGLTIISAATSSEYSTGRGGLGVLDDPGVSDFDLNILDDFEVGDLGAATVVRHRPIVIQ